MLYNAKRVVALRQEMQRLKVDAFLVTDRANIKYISGFTGDDGILLVTENQQYIITDSRFEQQVKTDNPEWNFCNTRDYLGSALKIAAQKHLVAMAFESNIDYASYDFLDENAVCDIVPFTGVIERLRSFKDDDEVALLKQSCILAGKGYQYILDTIHPGQTEAQVATELDYFMKMNGASQWSFETIVASGERTTWPHGTFTNKKLNDGDLITLDFGYYYQDYTSDVTRTFSLGKQVNAQVKDIYETVLEANQRTIAAIKPGITGRELDAIGREYIAQKGYGEYFNHGMGHGIGLSIHELPNVGRSYSDQMMPGQVVTIEPGIYVPGVGGVRIEDDILITPTGHENLTPFSKAYTEV